MNEPFLIDDDVLRNIIEACLKLTIRGIAGTKRKIAIGRMAASL